MTPRGKTENETTVGGKKDYGVLEERVHENKVLKLYRAEEVVGAYREIKSE